MNKPGETPMTWLGSKNLYRDFFKRGFDIVIAALLLVLVLPMMAFISFLIRVVDGHKPLLRQERVGRNEQLFTIFKFRTMRDGEECDAVRITQLGYHLRKLRLDELPQLLNVLRGDMSIVGPRPILPTIYSTIVAAEPEFRTRHNETRPGITGLAQIRAARAEVDQSRRVAFFDNYYLCNLSIWLDLYVLWQTVAVITSRNHRLHAADQTNPRLGQQAH